MSKKTSRLCPFEVGRSLREKNAKIVRLREENERLLGLLKECQPYLAVRDTRGLWGKITKELGNE